MCTDIMIYINREKVTVDFPRRLASLATTQLIKCMNNFFNDFSRME